MYNIYNIIYAYIKYIMHINRCFNCYQRKTHKNHYYNVQCHTSTLYKLQTEVYVCYDSQANETELLSLLDFSNLCSIGWLHKSQFPFFSSWP